MRVAFIVLDSLPNAWVGPEITPTLWAEVTGCGGWHPAGGRSVLASSTYPNHASFVTGEDVDVHRLFTNKVWDGAAFVPAGSVGPQVPTVFDEARSGGRSSAIITGAHTMVECMGGLAADVHWPPPDDGGPAVERDILGYPTNAAVINELASSGALDCDLVVAHVNDPDSTLHALGPDDPDAKQRVREVDADLASMLDLLRPRWDDTVVCVVSDHDQEQVDHDLAPIRLSDVLGRESLPGHAHDEGTIGLIVDGPDVDTLICVDELEGARTLDSTHTLVWSERGRVFGASHKTINGQHGSPRTATQVAAVTGGHPEVQRLAAWLESTSPCATDWADVMRRALH